ncbi:MAG: DNA primase [Thermoproteota archaeon]|nr:DNA primase [Thermoproteota archaeon]
MITSKDTDKSIAFMKNAFRQYYFKHSKNIGVPTRMKEREFGYKQFSSGIVRHLSFRNIGELLAILIREAPSDIYCSNAFYRFPSYPMQEKQWDGADLIFDIDAKDLHLPCEQTHSYFLCINCGEVLERNVNSCPKCDFSKLNHISVPCNKCVHSLKKEVMKLVNLLITDLGIKKNCIEVYFSGNNGFHLHILDTRFNTLDSRARADIVGYLMGIGMMTESIGVRKRPEGIIIKFPKSGLSYGWRKRIANKLGIDQMSTVKLNNIVQQKGGYDGFKEELSRLTREGGVRIDPNVTTDIHRIFRMPGTLNSKSGLAKMRCDDLELFDPFIDACLLGENEVNVKVKAHVNLKLKGQSFKIKKQTERLPLYVAVYLICKGIAELS